MNIKHLIGYILLTLISIGILGICVYAFFACGYSIIESFLFMLVTCVITVLMLGIVYLFIWLFD